MYMNFLIFFFDIFFLQKPKKFKNMNKVLRVPA